MNEKLYIRDFRIYHSHKQSLLKKPKKTLYEQGHNDGWNDCMSYLKAVGKI